jgi:hypothetical protein
MPQAVLIRTVKRPREDRGALLAIYLDTTHFDPQVGVYAIARDSWTVEGRRAVLLRTRRANPNQVAEATQKLYDLGERVIVLKGAPRPRPSK